MPSIWEYIKELVYRLDSIVLNGMVSNPLCVDDLSFGLVLNFAIYIISVIK